MTERHHWTGVDNADDLPGSRVVWSPDEHLRFVRHVRGCGLFLLVGHRHIGAITGPRGMLASDERERGHSAALAAGGVLPSPHLIVESRFDVPGGRRGAEQLLNLPAPPTAIFAFSDQIAIGVLHAALARGLRVPDDLSIVGFDDTPEAELVMPALTTVRQPLAEMGRMGVSLLMRLLENRRLEALHVELATQLIIRDSTAPARAVSLVRA